tara:strand:+ start:6468 stop:6953 length:486 start_codon:yes stop_codon:yes gene_type:complete
MNKYLNILFNQLIMIYILEELLKLDDSNSFINYIKDQFEIILNYKISNIHTIYKISKTTICFVDVDSKMKISGIIIISCKDFLFNEKIFFLEFLNSISDNRQIEESLLNNAMAYMKSLVNENNQNEMIISLLMNDQINNEILIKNNFQYSNDLMSSIILND